jgi:hypothetical protein
LVRKEINKILGWQAIELHRRASVALFFGCRLALFKFVIAAPERERWVMREASDLVRRLPTLHSDMKDEFWDGLRNTFCHEIEHVSATIEGCSKNLGFWERLPPAMTPQKEPEGVT